MTDTEFVKLAEYGIINRCYIPTSDASDEIIEMYPEMFQEVFGALIPANEKALEYIENSKDGDVLTFEECSRRDLSFHRCYMGLLGYIWEWLPKQFQNAIPKGKFYQWLKHLKKNYEVTYSFRDEAKKALIRAELKARKKEFRLTYKSINQIAELFGKTELLEYESLSFGRMTEKKFREYIREQLPWIYTEVIGKFYQGEQYQQVIDDIENNYETFFSKLNSK